MYVDTLSTINLNYNFLKINPIVDDEIINLPFSKHISDKYYDVK